MTCPCGVISYRLTYGPVGPALPAMSYCGSCPCAPCGPWTCPPNNCKCCCESGCFGPYY
ncbi:male-specific sperm protein Mst84Db-like [Scaptodrosophila lebanonensis]|uniref:Male-specific sperm protein Mst84Db-like n=1 Tax=Drosophila lebanonensis TaxID=7225 RepID=A0A6J2TE43_DROLE|nr:male-specific sperm protein Mst84Db-like [Scaptodrosophila lebanonensis]